MIIAKCDIFSEVKQFTDPHDILKSLSSTPHVLYTNAAVSENGSRVALAKKYLDYQKAVAKRVPREADRPSVALYLPGTTGDRTDDRLVVIVGGMGPMSDASITVNFVKRSGHGVVVLSLPPPRDSIVAFAKHLHCVRSIVAQLPHARKDIFMASNTAHVAFHAASSVFAYIPGVVVHNLVERVASHINTKYVGKRIVLLTTRVSWLARLYERKLRGQVVVRASEEDSTKLQESVDLAKANRAKDGAKILFEYIDRVYEPGSIIFLGCTDFVFLNAAAQARKRYPGAIVLDTDTLFQVEMVAALDDLNRAHDSGGSLVANMSLAAFIVAMAVVSAVK